MTEGSTRLQRIGDQIQRELAMLIQLEVNDPRIGMVSVTGVDVSRDLAHATVHVTILSTGSEKEGESSIVSASDEQERNDIEDSIKALNKAAGYLRSLLAKRLRLRTTPKLLFRYDSSISSGNKLSSLIDDALAADRNQHS